MGPAVVGAGSAISWIHSQDQGKPAPTMRWGRPVNGRVYQYL